ncbi:MAG: DUF5723 family protein [candidate division WOR-3 bacterium]
MTITTLVNPVLSSGPEGMQFNPAQLAYSERPGFCCKILDVGLGFDNNSFTFSQYNRYTGAYLDDQAKADILGSIPRSGVNLRLAGAGRAAEFGYQTFAANIQTTCRAEVDIPRDVFELLLSGNKLDRQYSARGARAEAEVLFRSGVGAGTAVGRDFALGMAVHYLRGLFRAELTECEVQFLTTNEKLFTNGRVGYRMATGGSGISFDAGVAWWSDRPEDPNDRWWKGWWLSLACLDISPGILWTDGTEQGVLCFRLDSANAYEISRGERFSHREELVAGEPFKTMVPMRVNLGLGSRLKEWLNNALLVQPVLDVSPFALREFRCGVLSELWLREWLPIGCEVAYQKGRGAVIGVDGALIMGKLTFVLGMSDVTGLFLAAKGAELRLSIAYGAFNERKKKERPFYMHASE